MPHSLRCRRYDEDGHPVKEILGGDEDAGCHNPDCRFIHPWQPEWDRPTRSSSARRPRGASSSLARARRRSPSSSESSMSRRSRSRSKNRGRNRSRSPVSRYRCSTRDRERKQDARSFDERRGRGRSWTRSRSRTRSRDARRARPSQLDKLTTSISSSRRDQSSLSSPEEGQILSHSPSPVLAAPSSLRRPTLPRYESTPTAPRAMRKDESSKSSSSSSSVTFAPVAPKALVQLTTRGTPIQVVAREPETLRDADMMQVTDAAPVSCPPPPPSAPPPPLPGDVDAVVALADVESPRDREQEATREGDQGGKAYSDSTSEIPVEERAKMENQSEWAARVDLLLQATTARAELTKLELDIATQLTLVDSSAFSSLPNAIQASIRANVDALKQRKEEQAEQWQSALSRLCLSGEWPTFPRAGAGKAEKEKDKEIDQETLVNYGPPEGEIDVRATVDELKEAVAQLQASLSDLQVSRDSGTSTPATVRPGSERELSKQEADSTDDLPPITTIPADAEPEDDEMAVDDTAELVFPDDELEGADAEVDDLEGLRIKLSDIEERFANMESDNSSHDQLWQDEVEDFIRDRVQEAREATPQPTASVPWNEAQPKLAERLEALEAEMQVTGDQVSELAESFLPVVRSKPILEERIKELDAENEALRKQVAELTDRLAQTETSYKTQLDDTQREMRSLADLVSRYEQERTTPHTQPLLGVPGDTLADVLLPGLEIKLRQKMQGLVSDVDHSTRRLITESTESITSNVMPKIALTVRVAETIESILYGHGFRTVPSH